MHCHGASMPFDRRSVAAPGLHAGLHAPAQADDHGVVHAAPQPAPRVQGQQRGAWGRQRPAILGERSLTAACVWSTAGQRGLERVGVRRGGVQRTRVHPGAGKTLATVLRTGGCAWLVHLTSRIQDLELKGDVPIPLQRDHTPRHVSK